MKLATLLAVLLIMPFALAACPSSEETDFSISQCKAIGGWVSNKTNSSGCIEIVCDKHGRKEITCSKVIDTNQCVLVSCSDGYSHNSCDVEGVCRELQAKKNFWTRLKDLF